jgi:type IX secretion system PorP/SprF family membrane protein
MKRITFIFIVISVMAFNTKAQDVHFSQFNASPLQLNPALTGAFNADHRLTANFKTQWKSIINKPYTTFSFSYDAGILKKSSRAGFLGLGIYAYNDRGGDSKLNTTQFDISAAYHLLANSHNYLTLGLQGGFIFKSLQDGALRWDAQYDPSIDGGYNPALSSGETVGFGKSNVVDVSAGFLWSFNSNPSNMASNDGVKLNLGISAFHLNQPKISFVNHLDKKLYARFTVHTNMFIGLKNSNLAILPSALFNIQGPSTEIIAGTYLRYRLKNASHFTRFEIESAIALGGFYRVGDAVIIALTGEWKNFTLGFSYDVNVSGLTDVSRGRGGLEVSIKYITPIFSANNKSLF